MNTRTDYAWLAPRSSPDDRTYLRDLAREVRDIAALPVMEHRRARWRAHNALRPGRPLVLCYPEGSWAEILPDAALRTADPLHRQLERQLLQRLFQHHHINDDQPVEAAVTIPWAVTIGTYGFDIPFTHGDDRGSYVWDPPVKNLAKGLRHLRSAPLAVDRDKTARNLARTRDILGDLLPVHPHGSMCWTLGLTWEAVKLIGLEQLMWAMVDEPEDLHRLMAFLRDEALHFVAWWERERLVSPNDTPGAYVGSGGLGLVDDLRGPNAPQTPVDLAHRWGFAESQETVGVSPAMFEEFIFPYQVPLLERFGLNCYGCCEGLEHRIGSILAHIPRLRRVSVAPSANQEKLAAALTGTVVYSRKVYPAHVCVGFNEPAIRADLRHTLSLARGQPLELILKDTHTVEHDPARITRWVQIAREEIEHAS